MRNTSTGVPSGFDSSDQLLAGVSRDFGAPGIVTGDPEIIRGSVVIGPTSLSLNFDTGFYPAGSNASGEYGFGNMDGSGALINFVSSNIAGAIPFGGANLDGPLAIDGPQAGLVANPVPVPPGGLGAIQDEIIVTLSISEPLSDFQFLHDNLVRVEFGSDAAFITTPEPGAAALLAIGLPGSLRRR